MKQAVKDAVVETAQETAATAGYGLLRLTLTVAAVAGYFTLALRLEGGLELGWLPLALGGLYGLIWARSRLIRDVAAALIASAGGSAALLITLIASQTGGINPAAGIALASATVAAMIANFWLVHWLADALS